MCIKVNSLVINNYGNTYDDNYVDSNEINHSDRNTSASSNCCFYYLLIVLLFLLLNNIVPVMKIRAKNTKNE